MNKNKTISIDEAYSGAHAKKIAIALAEEIANFLEKSNTEPYQGLPWREPREITEEVSALQRSPLRENTAEFARFLAKSYLEKNNQLHSPHYMGHQVPPPLPLAGIFQAVAGVSNQGVGIFEMGPFAVAAERTMITELGSYLGWEKGKFDAIVTHGGSLANLTALLAARNQRFSDSWGCGISTAPEGKPAVLTSADSHYSIMRAAGIIGLGADQVIKAPINAQRQIDIEKLPAAYAAAKAKGINIFAIVGSACSTPIGAFDDLRALADFANQHKLWFHVDGAHGAPMLLSKKHAHLLRGVERADSVTWDAHKMMFSPSLCTFLFYRDARHSYAPFHQDAPYLFTKQEEATLYDSALRTLECTKGAAILPVWAAWTAYGPQLFSDLVDRMLATTRSFYEMLEAAPDFEALHEPECNILCFRYLPEQAKAWSREKISELQQRVRDRLVKQGEYYITGTNLDGSYVLRVTLINPHTAQAHLAGLLSAIREIS